MCFTSLRFCAIFYCKELFRDDLPSQGNASSSIHVMYYHKAETRDYAAYVDGSTRRQIVVQSYLS